MGNYPAGVTDETIDRYFGPDDEEDEETCFCDESQDYECLACRVARGGFRKEAA